MTGLTGIIKFDHQGFRSDFVLDIIELNNKEGLKKIGTWNSTKGINFTRSYGDVYSQIVENLQNKTFIVTTLLVSDISKECERLSFLKHQNNILNKTFFSEYEYLNSISLNLINNWILFNSDEII